MTICGPARYRRRLPVPGAGVPRLPVDRPVGVEEQMSRTPAEAGPALACRRAASSSPPSSPRFFRNWMRCCLRCASVGVLPVGVGGQGRRYQGERSTVSAAGAVQRGHQQDAPGDHHRAVEPSPGCGRRRAGPGTTLPRAGPTRSVTRPRVLDQRLGVAPARRHPERRRCVASMARAAVRSGCMRPSITRAAGGLHAPRHGVTLAGCAGTGRSAAR